MDILIVTSDMNGGGAETHVYELARFLTKRGNSVTVVSSGGQLAEAFSGEGIEHISLPLSSKSPSDIVSSYRGLKGILRQDKYDVVHAHTRLSSFIASAVCERQGVPFVSTVHARYRDSLLLDRLSRWGRATVAVSQDLCQYLIEHSADVLAENIRVIPNGIDTERFSPSVKAEGERRIVFASRLDGDCSAAAYSLCKISKRLAQRYPDIRIVICGGGERYPDICKISDEINGSMGRELISTVGHISDMSVALRGASVFVGVSRAALEAMSCAVPVVLGGNEGFFGAVTQNDLMRCEKSNFCCRGERAISEEALFSEISAVLDMPRSQREALGVALREYVIKHHSAELMARKTEEVYRLAVLSIEAEKKGVLLCGYYGFGNMGDDALLLRAIERARQRFPLLPVCAMTKRGKRDERRFGVRCARRSDAFALMREIRRCEVLVFGGGTLLQSSTSSRSLYYYTRILRYARRYAKRIELWGNGIEKIKGKRDRAEAARALCACDLVELRDRSSVREAISLLSQAALPAPKLALESDLAATPFYTDRGRAEYVLSLLGVDSCERMAVICVRGTEARGEVERMKAWLYALKKDGIRLIFIAMCPKEDLVLSRRLCRELGGTLAYPLGIADVTELIRRAALVCSMRYHALVFAASVGTPFIGFGSEGKIKSFCRERDLTFLL